MLNVQHFRDHVIRPTLHHLGLWSESAENLLLGTALVESGLRHLVQLGGGPALGVYQMEPETHDDIYLNYLRFRPIRMEQVVLMAAPGDDEHDWLERDNLDWLCQQLIWNLGYATSIARIHYLRVPSPLPPHDDVEAQAKYWKAHYNSNLGNGTPDKYIQAWKGAFA